METAHLMKRGLLGSPKMKRGVKKAPNTSMRRTRGKKKAKAHPVGTETSIRNRQRGRGKPKGKIETNAVPGRTRI